MVTDVDSLQVEPVVLVDCHRLGPASHLVRVEDEMHLVCHPVLILLRQLSQSLHGH